MKYKEFTTSGGFAVLSGQDDEGNEYLSLRLAAPGDYWFHVHGFPGSHVVLRVPSGGDDPSKADLKEAAAVAAYFSKMREGGEVSVSVCRAKDVSKPRGAKRGTVSIRNESRLRVRPALPPTAKKTDAE